MGLDITAYSRLKPVGKHTAAGEWCDNEDHITAFAYDSFPASFRGIPLIDIGTFTVAGGKFLEGGCYETTPETETVAFRAGSYTGYSMWRDDLRAQFNPRLDPDRPFYELIWFADNEGTIGPDAARDLLADFRAHADTYVNPDGWGDVYARWTRACELAADGGLIHFH